MKFLQGFLGIMALLCLVCLILGLPLMLLWNWLMPLVFGLPTLTFWQAVGMNLLASILFGKTTSTTK
jgi:hypothetical protein